MKKTIKYISDNKLAVLGFVLSIVAYFFDHASGVATSLATVTVCGKITSSLSPDCTTPLHGGVDDRLILVNWDDFQNAVVTRNGANPQIIENIILPTGITAYAYQGKNGSVVPKSTLVVQKYAEVYDHEVSAVVFDVSPVGKQQLEKGVQGRFVLIVQNRYKGTSENCAFEVYGLDAGLRVSALTRDPNSADTQGAYMVTFKTDDKAQAYENHLPATYFEVDFATTLNRVNGLLS